MHCGGFQGNDDRSDDDARRNEQGQIVEENLFYDLMGMLKQMGVRCQSVVVYPEHRRGWAKLPPWKRRRGPPQFSESSGGLNHSDESFYFHLLSFDWKLRNAGSAPKCLNG